MTAHSDEHGSGGPIDRDLAGWYEVFTAKIEEALDVEAGLRDILSQSGHETFTAKVENALDVEAGLRDILIPSADQVPSSPSPAIVPPVANAAPGSSRWQASPAQRLKLRSNPRVTAASRVLRDAGSRIDNSSAPVLSFDVTLDFDLVRALDLVHALDRVRDLVRALNYDRDRARDRERDLVRVLDNGIAHARDLVHTLNLLDVRVRVRDLDLTLDLARDLVRDLDRDLDLDRARVLDRARALDRALSDARTSVLDHVRSCCLEIINDEYTQVAGRPVAVDEGSLTSLMDDFTTDDLSDAEVREGGIELAGVRWSDGTTWPASTDIDYLKRRSDRQEDGSWIIRAGTGNERENVLT